MKLSRSWIFLILTMPSIVMAQGIAQPPAAIGMDAWFDVNDNLPEAQVYGLDGVVEVMLDIDDNGSVVGCRVEQSSGHDALDNHTCDLVSKKGRFRPAKDANGNPVPGKFRYLQRWQATTMANWASYGHARAEMTVEPDGSASNCSTTIEGELSENMRQMLCFILVNQISRITETYDQVPTEAFEVSMVLAFSYDDADRLSAIRPLPGWRRISMTNAIVAVNEDGLRTDCKLVETRGVSSMIFPTCNQTPAFRYRPRNDDKGQPVATVLQQTVAYFVAV